MHISHRYFKLAVLVLQVWPWISKIMVGNGSGEPPSQFRKFVLHKMSIGYCDVKKTLDH